MPPSTPFVYPPHAGEIYNHEQAVAAMGGLSFQRPNHFYEQERLAEIQRMMYHKQQQQHGMHAENHMMSPAVMQNPYFQGMVMYPEMLAAAAAAGGTTEEMILRQRMMAAAAVAQVAPHTPSPEMNHFQFDPRVLMQYNAMPPGAHQEEQVYVQMMEARLTQFVQHVMPLMQQPGFATGQMLQPEFVTELQKHYDLFRHLLLRNPANQHNPLFLQIGQVLEHLMAQQRASMEQHPVVKSSVIVNSSH